MQRIVIAAAVAALLAAAAPAGAADNDPPPGSPQWYARAAANHAYAHGRNIDQLSNPAFLAAVASHLDACHEAEPVRDICLWTDPYRADWGASRGTVREISYRNRYGARISGRVWAPSLPFQDPVTGGVSRGPFPGVIVVNGGGAAEQSYWGMAQGLAESGYVVMTFDPQGQGASEAMPNPRSEFCDPSGAWREPQEMGVREYGSCAGVPPEEPLDQFPLFAANCMLNTCGGAYQDEFYELNQARFVFGALDAASWFLSDANPVRGLVDERRLGVAGHSQGARAALMAGNGDPLRRFDAAVSWDTGSSLPGYVAPRVPTMLQTVDSEEAGGPYRSPPDPDGRPSSPTTARFREAGVDTMQIVLRGSTHQEWNYTPPFGVAVAGQLVASRDGERVGLYYTLAWFDRYLKGQVGPGRPDAKDARRRLVARVFDGSADRSSIGQGSWDPVTRTNVPYTIGGETVHEHLSFYYRSSYAFDGLRCSDVRTGCG